MKILFVSEYTGNNISGNNNVYRQILALNKVTNHKIDVLTTLHGDHWTYKSDKKEKYFTDIINNINYHIINDKKLYTHRVLSKKKWKESVSFGIMILTKIKPDVLHLQHWRNLWWLLESAQILKIKTIYSPHDWGMICLRTILVNTENKLCDGVVNINKCAICIKKRKSFLGKMNETLVSFKFLNFLLLFLDKYLLFNNLFTKYKIELHDSETRSKLHQNRINNIISRLDNLIVPNEFAKTLFTQFKIDTKKIIILPWYYDKPNSNANKSSNIKNKLVIGYIGRISEDKGVKRILEALSSDIILEPIHLLIAGDYNSDYGISLYNKYNINSGKHTIEWMGWLPHDSIENFYNKIDLALLISEWIENGPLTLYESFAYNCPVIINDTPNVKDYVIDNVNGFKVKSFSTHDIALKIKFVQENPQLINIIKNNIKPFHTSTDYASELNKIYESI